MPLSQKHLDSPPPSPSRPYLLTSPSSSFSSSSPTQILSLAEEQSVLAAFDFTPTRIRAPHSVWSDELDPNGEIRKSMMSDELPLTTDYDEDEFSLTMDGFDEMVSSLVEELPPKKKQQQQQKKKKKQQPPPSLSSSLLKSPHSDKWKVKSDEFNKMTGIKSVENWYLAKEIEILKKPSARHSTAETIIYDHRTSSLAPIDILAELKLSQLGSVAALWAQTVVYTRGELAGNRLRSDIIEKYFGNCLSYIRRRHNREDDLNEKLGFQEAKLSCGQFGDFRLAAWRSSFEVRSGRPRTSPPTALVRGLDNLEATRAPSFRSTSTVSSTASPLTWTSSRRATTRRTGAIASPSPTRRASATT